MNFTIEQKEQITAIFATLYHKVNHARGLSEAMEHSTLHEAIVQSWSRDIKESLESAVRYVDKLKQCLMEIAIIRAEYTG